MKNTKAGSLVACVGAVASLAVVITPVAGRAQNVCGGDCNGDGAVTVNEIIGCVNIALGLQPLNGCGSCDADGSGTVEIGEIIAGVDAVLQGCSTSQCDTFGGAAACASCPNYVDTEKCMELKPGDKLPQPLSSCYVIKQQGTYVADRVNILKDGRLLFVEDPMGTIDFRVSSLLVEYGGLLQAGSESCPFGQQGGKLTIGLYGNDPNQQNTPVPSTTPTPAPPIQCMTNPASADQPCFPKDLNVEKQGHYCTEADSDNPCSPLAPPTGSPTATPTGSPIATPTAAPCAGYPSSSKTTCQDNYRLEHYGALNFDPNSWGYKVLGVSYGGRLRLFGYKGAKPLQGTGFADSPDDHCAVPTESGLDVAEVNAWAKLTGSSWVRLQGLSADRAELTLDRSVSGDWAPGDQIVVGTTDWYPGHSEVRTIYGFGADGTRIRLCKPVQGGTGPGGCADRSNHPETPAAGDALDYPHSAAIFDLSTYPADTFTAPVNRKAADLRAAVGLLSRSIQIRSLGDKPNDDFPKVESCVYDGTDRGKPECYFGGHTMIRQGFAEAQIQGVEFKQLGQGGRIGHYPVHFHLAKSTAYTHGKAFVKDSSIWDSMTRFVVLHGTHNVTVARNVGYLSVGNGYYIEDGSEIENKLCYNLGVSARGALREFYEAQKPFTTSPLARAIPPILDGVAPIPAAGTPAHRRLGSDSLMPVMFWAMNAYNEFVGNAAVGVHGFGSCYWLLGSSVSGPSATTHSFAGLAKYNVAGAYQAPLLRFRGNSCSTATYALPTQVELEPADLGEAPHTGYTAVTNPYIANQDGSPKPANATFQRPAVSGNFQPIEPDAGATTCAQTVSAEGVLEHNPKACTTGIIDRFTTSFNWAQTNYGSIWLRPWYYLLLNSVVTDQLFGGVTFVTGGSWVQAPPAYVGLIKNSLFVGTSQLGNTYASRSGPIFSLTKDADLTSYAPCATPNGITCNLPVEGTGYWRGEIQPKRLINIYDGPQFADGNLFMNVGSWTCDPQPCENKGTVAECNLSNKRLCGIYSATTQPYQPGDNNSRMVVLDAALGWKQPNGFYYPPAFAYRKSAFFKTVPDALKDLNQCYSYGAPDYTNPAMQPGTCRHNAIDRTRPYIAGDMQKLKGSPTIFAQNTASPLSVTPIDFSTILIDLDGTLTGADGSVAGVEGLGPTSSVSRNHFFDAPAQTPECLSYGVQTSPYGYVTTVVAPLKDAPKKNHDTNVAPWTWKNPAENNREEASSPVVAIYRQWALAGDDAECGQVCNGANFGCSRGTFMVGPNIGHAPSLTMSQPPTLPSQMGTLYYIDTSTASQQKLDCIKGKTAAMNAATFSANKSYVVYHLYARNDSKASYQFYVGDNVDLDAIQGAFVRVFPHLTASQSTNPLLTNFLSQVNNACNPKTATPADWCYGMQADVNKATGILTVTLDNTKIAKDFKFDTRKDYEKCMPRDVCYYDSDSKSCKPCLGDTTKVGCTRQQDLVAADITSMNATDATGKGPLDVICQDWSSYASGTKTETVGELSLVDCPTNGCLGFAFTLPNGFVGDKTYEAKGKAGRQCFLRDDWLNKSTLVALGDGKTDPLCGLPRAAMAADFCGSGPIPTATQTPTGATRTPTPAATATRTATGGATRTPTRVTTSTRTPTGGATRTATRATTPTPSRTRTPAPTVTPTAKSSTTPTNTPTPGGSGFTWVCNGGAVTQICNGKSAATTITVPLGGVSYPPMDPNLLILQDSLKRFCTEAGKHPIVQVKFGEGNTSTIGVFGTDTVDSQGVAAIPPAPQRGTYDVFIQTPPDCKGAPLPLLMPGAIKYGE